jgi:thiol-disulfide isomerase/thioredoxin
MSSLSRRALAALALVAVIGGCAGTATTSRTGAPVGPVVGNPAPEIAGKDLDGKPLSLQEFRGKVVMLSFWAGWCKPCLHLIPHEQEVQKRFEGKPFVLLGVNKDDTIEKGRQAQEHYGVTWRSFWDGDNAIVAAYEVDAYPYVFVIDHKGVIRYVARGVSPSVEREIDKMLDALVKDAEAGS